MKLVAVLALCGAFLTATGMAPAAETKALPDPEALALSREILAATHANALGDQMLTQLVKAFSDGLNRVNPGKAHEVEDLLNQVFVPEFRKSIPDLMDQSAHIYALNFSVTELKQILEFYHSEIGAKMVDRMPEILREQGELSRAFMQSIMPGIEAKMREALQAKGLRSPNGI
jgi:hypothetical protein